MTRHRVNQVSDLLSFLESWENRDHPGNRKSLRRFATSNGRVTSADDPEPGHGPLVSRHHPQFAEFIEPRIRPLVQRLIEDWRCVTYSSCDGHLEPGGGIVPRALGMLDLGGTWWRLLSLMADTALSRAPRTAAATVTVQRTRLESPQGPSPAVEILFEPKPGVSWGEYRAACDRLTSELLHVERELAVQLRLHI